MSEYQYYEFQALDRPLTPKEQKAVAGLSSRVDPHPTRAVFVYNYSDLSADPLDLLARYYDAFFYIANWGTTRLAFRLPRTVVDVAAMQPYLVGYHVELHETDEHVLLEVTHDDEGGYGWIDGEGSLGPLLGLRDELLRGDRRLLYLAWLSALDHWDPEDTDREPPVPPGLQKLTAPQKAFVEQFHLDPFLVKAAAEASAQPSARSEQALVQAVDALPAAERRAWLLRLAQGEPNLDIALRRALLGEQPSAAGQRTAAELVERADSLRQAHEHKAAAAAEKRRVRELEAFAPQAGEAWERALALIEERKPSGYAEAVELLTKLHQLAIHEGTETVFAQDMQELREKYPKRPALQRRLDEAELP